MKFTNGYWLLRDEYQMDFATDLYEGEINGDALKLVVASRAVRGRGDILNIATLSVALTSPMENVVRVAITHHKGRVTPQPALPLETETVAPQLSQADGRFVFQSGELRAEASASGEPWNLRFIARGKTLTGTGYRGMAYAREKQSQTPYMIEQLDIAPGELVYGLGDGFTAYVKNGQVGENWTDDGARPASRLTRASPFT